MTPENFCYWLRGYIELTGNAELSKEQVQVINEHLDLVLVPQVERLRKIRDTLESLDNNFDNLVDLPTTISY